MTHRFPSYDSIRVVGFSTREQARQFARVVIKRLNTLGYPCTCARGTDASPANQYQSYTVLLDINDPEVRYGRWNRRTSDPAYLLEGGVDILPDSYVDPESGCKLPPITHVSWNGALDRFTHFVSLQTL